MLTSIMTNKLDEFMFFDQGMYMYVRAYGAKLLLFPIAKGFDSLSQHMDNF
jgi:hypothetical protein